MEAYLKLFEAFVVTTTLIIVPNQKYDNLKRINLFYLFPEDDPLVIEDVLCWSIDCLVCCNKRNAL